MERRARRSRPSAGAKEQQTLVSSLYQANPARAMLRDAAIQQKFPKKMVVPRRRTFLLRTRLQIQTDSPPSLQLRSPFG